MKIICTRYPTYFVSFLQHKLLSQTFVITRNSQSALHAQFPRRSFAMENGTQSNKDEFNFANYNCIGFDLDNTIARYKVSNLVQLEYDALSKFLIEHKHYSPEALQKPIDTDFLQKGLILDFHRGNILKVSNTGFIWRASHGTQFLTDQEIEAVYGVDHNWEVTSTFVRDPLVTWNGPLSEQMRSLLDYFDMPAALAFARLVDHQDLQRGEGGGYTVWPDVLDGLLFMFNRMNFAAEDGGHLFNGLRRDPASYLNPCSPEVVTWLRGLRQAGKTITFLITGSNADFAAFTATHCLGAEWRDLFDVVVSFARKPFFFIGSKPFLELKGFVEGDIVEDPASQVQPGRHLALSQGNWQQLLQVLERVCGCPLRSLYVGDNVVQDLHAPAVATHTHTLGVIEELWSERGGHPEAAVLNSERWGSYFGSASVPSLWHGFLSDNTRLVVPNMETLISLPLERPIPTGYFPGPPPSH